jgi:hypothetical protein
MRWLVNVGEQVVLYSWQIGHASLVAFQLVAVAWLGGDPEKDVKVKNERKAA